MASEIAIRLALIGQFPGLAQSQFDITSNPDPFYNCIAWAAGRMDRFWWPGHFWPKGAPKKVTRASFISAFESIGYDVCGGPELENGFEKVMIYECNGEPTHAARLLADGRWTSKLGSSHDIAHTIDSLNGAIYGTPALFMRRPI